MPKRARGLMSQANLDAMRIAEVLQAEAMLYIRDAFEVEEAPAFEINGLTWEKFNEVLDKAERDGTRDQLEGELARIMSEALMQMAQIGVTNG